MTYRPIIPTGGNLGWAFLTRTREAQQSAFRSSAVVTRQTDYFLEKIGSVRSAEDLVKDHRLLTVALGAFGLDDDIQNKFFVRKVLEEGVRNDEAFANRLADKRYFALAEAFGFELDPPNTVLSDFPQRIVEQFRTRQFEVAVGDQDEDLRLAMSLDREIATMTDRNLSESGAWFTIMGTPPLRRVFETAFGLPSATGAIDVDRQLEIFRDKSLKYFGTANPADFASPERQEDLVRRFLLKADLGATTQGTVRGSVALSLLSAQAGLSGG